MMGKTEKRNVKTEKLFLKKASKDDILVKTSNTSSGNFFVTSEMDKTAEENSKTLRKKKDIKLGKIKNAAVNKTFDKKKWRLRKYSKKYKLEQWENKRKKKVFQEFYKQVKDEQPSFNVQKIYEKYSEENENENNLNKNVQESRVRNETQTKTKNKKKPQEEFQRIREESKGKKEQIAKQKVARAEAKKEYKAKKLEKIKKLNKKTKKGQPIMKYRMEMLLEQIQQSIS